MCSAKASTDCDPLDRLPATFSYSAARAAGLSNARIYQLRDQGLVERVGRGLYRRRDADPGVDLDLLEIALKAPRGTLSLTSALAHHDLIDDIPDVIHIALPRGHRRPQVTPPVAWHAFDVDTFDIGRNMIDLDNDVAIGLYSPERCVVDAFRLPHIVGYETTYIALRRWLRRHGNHLSTLEEMASHFSRAQRRLRGALEVLTSE